MICGNGTVYVGLADTYFYVINPRGRVIWRFKTGNLIDSAGFVGAWNSRLHTNPIAVPSGDTYLYLIRSRPRALARNRRIIWKYTPPFQRSPIDETQLVNWWEGNAEPGPDGTMPAAPATPPTL